MTTERFWVVGGEYSCLDFKTLTKGAQVLGPFDTRDEARTVWRRVSCAKAKFSIASEQLVLPA
jgi:hypothetical protein